jgi:tRNA A37 threonylcarbamoyladenosine biosynthesis protein TsaE
MEYTIYNVEEMENVARDILAALPRGAHEATVLTLSGDLGAGKTTFTQAFAKALGIKGRVTSPTFGIMRLYDISPSFCEGEEEICHSQKNVCHPEQKTCHSELDSESTQTLHEDNTSKIPDHQAPFSPRQKKCSARVRNENRDDSETRKEKSCHSGLDPESRECDFTTLIHIDAYRLEGGKDMEMLDWKNMLADPTNLIVIEWPERIADILPKDTVRLSFEHVDETTRKVKV